MKIDQYRVQYGKNGALRSPLFATEYAAHEWAKTHAMREDYGVTLVSAPALSIHDSARRDMHSASAVQAWRDRLLSNIGEC